MVDILGKKAYNYFIMVQDKINKLINDANILNLYYYGSTVYKSTTEKSDIDLIAIVKNKTDEQVLDSINISFYTVDEFQNKIDLHDISALECLFLQSIYILKNNKKFELNLDLYKLRCSCSEKASKSFVKAKKKIKEGNIYIGQKSLFHSIRIIDFAIQLTKFKKIEDFSSVSHLLPIILKEDPTFVVEKFKPIYNSKKSELRKLESGH